MNKLFRGLAGLVATVVLIAGVAFVAAPSSTATPRHIPHAAQVAQTSNNYVIAYTACPGAKGTRHQWIQQLVTLHQATEQWFWLGASRKALQGWVKSAVLYGRHGNVIDRAHLLACK